MLIKALNHVYQDGLVWIILNARYLGLNGPKRPKFHIVEISQPISHYWMELRLRLLLNTNRKSCMTFKMVTFNLTLRDLERSNSRSRIFQQPISHYWMELRLRLLLNTNRKSHMTFKMVTFNLTLSDLERSNSRSRIFQQPISHYWMELGLRLLLNTNRKSWILS
jgi:hypothetical protein